MLCVEIIICFEGALSFQQNLLKQLWKNYFTFFVKIVWNKVNFTLSSPRDCILMYDFFFFLPLCLLLRSCVCRVTWDIRHLKSTHPLLQDTPSIPNMSSNSLCWIWVEFEEWSEWLSSFIKHEGVRAPRALLNIPLDIYIFFFYQSAEHSFTSWFEFCWENTSTEPSHLISRFSLLQCHSKLMVAHGGTLYLKWTHSLRKYKLLHLSNENTSVFYWLRLTKNIHREVLGDF